MPVEVTTRDGLRSLLDDARRELLSSIEGLGEERMSEPMPDGWSVKDVLAHVAMWDETDLADMVRAARGHRPRWGHWSPLVDRCNDVEFHLRKEVPLDQVMAELSEARQGLLEFLRFAPEELLAAGFIPTACAVQARHDRDHATQIREWRRRREV